MQVLKEEVKQRIVLAAMDEFFYVGYNKASLREIAKKANITVGTIYAYFKNKKDLFEFCINPSLLEMNAMITSLSKGEFITTISLNHLAQEITNIFLRNKQQFLILMIQSQGTPYEDTKQQAIVRISLRLNQELLPFLPNTPDELLATTIATALIEGLLTIFTGAFESEHRIRHLVASFLHILFGDIQAPLSQ